MKAETILALQIAAWLDKNNVMYRFDINNDFLRGYSCQLVSRLQGKNSRGWPDLMVMLRCRHRVAFLELKTSKEKTHTKAGRLRKSEHVAEQQKMLRKLRARGVVAKFVYSLEDVIQLFKEHKQCDG